MSKNSVPNGAIRRDYAVTDSNRETHFQSDPSSGEATPNPFFCPGECIGNYMDPATGKRYPCEHRPASSGEAERLAAALELATHLKGLPDSVKAELRDAAALLRKQALRGAEEPK